VTFFNDLNATIGSVTLSSPGQEQEVLLGSPASRNAHVKVNYSGSCNDVTVSMMPGQHTNMCYAHIPHAKCSPQWRTWTGGNAWLQNCSSPIVWQSNGITDVIGEVQDCQTIIKKCEIKGGAGASLEIQYLVLHQCNSLCAAFKTTNPNRVCWWGDTGVNEPYNITPY